MLALLLVIPLVTVCGQTVFPHGHALTLYVDQSFDQLDHSPKDSVVTKVEWDVIKQYFDNDTDGCVTLQEYGSYAPEYSSEIIAKFFHNIDHNHDQCVEMSDMLDEFHLIDHNHDGRLEKHEYEHYYTKLINHLFGHGHNGVIG